MSTAKPNPATPKTLACPHCRAQMNLTGRGRAPGSVIYCCSGCVALLRMKELWLGQVVRTGTLGFGFVQLQGPQGMAALRFDVPNFFAPNGKATAGNQPRVGEQVLVLLSQDARQADKVWRLVPAANHNGAAGHNGAARPALRHRGIITAVKTPDWGFLTDEKTGQAYFIHRTDLVGGGPLLLGQRVTFLPTVTNKGQKACEVRFGGGC